jgi:hypothetical protein
MDLFYNTLVAKVRFLGKFAGRHCYFLAFAKTDRSIMSLQSTIIILWQICQNTPHCPKQKVLIFITQKAR